MNSSGHEVLRKEVALLVEKMDMFYIQLFEFERKYLYNSDELTERLAAQLIKPIKKQMQDIAKRLQNDYKQLRYISQFILNKNISFCNQN